MKIGIVSPYAYPRPGGANSYIRESYEELRRLGHDVRIITAPWGDDPPAQDVIQIGQAIAVPYNGAIGRITLSLRSEWPWPALSIGGGSTSIHHTHRRVRSC